MVWSGGLILQYLSWYKEQTINSWSRQEPGLKQTKGGSSNRMWLRSGTWDALGAKGLGGFKGGQDRSIEKKSVKDFYIYSTHVSLRKTLHCKCWKMGEFGRDVPYKFPVFFQLLSDTDPEQGGSLLWPDTAFLMFLLGTSFFLIVILFHCFLLWLLWYLTHQLFLVFLTASKDGNSLYVQMVPCTVGARLLWSSSAITI